MKLERAKCQEYESAENEHVCTATRLVLPPVLCRHVPLHKGIGDMNLDPQTPPILLWPRLPARLSRREAAYLLNFRDEESISVLVRAKLLKPLGNPPEGAPMWFATVYILRLSQNEKWLDKATKIVRETVNIRNSKKAEDLK